MELVKSKRDPVVVLMLEQNKKVKVTKEQIKAERVNRYFSQRIRTDPNKDPKKFNFGYKDLKDRLGNVKYLNEDFQIGKKLMDQPDKYDLDRYLSNY